MICLVLPDIAAEDRLMEQARQGNKAAVAEIYDLYFEPIYQFIRLRVDDPALAEDLTADVFLRLLTALRGRNAPRQSLRGWLFRVARHVIHDHYGRHKRLRTTVLEEWLPAPESANPETQVFAAVALDQVRGALGQLSDEQQEVLVLRFGQLLNLQETAAIMGKEVGAVKSLQFRATRRLRDLLADQPPPERDGEPSPAPNNQSFTKNAGSPRTKEDGEQS